MRWSMLDDDSIVAFAGGMERIFAEYRLLQDMRLAAAPVPLTTLGGAARQLEPREDPVSTRVAFMLVSDRYSFVVREIVAVRGRALVGRTDCIMLVSFRH